jgi:hypothetical protein
VQNQTLETLWLVYRRLTSRKSGLQVSLKYLSGVRLDVVMDLVLF